MVFAIVFFAFALFLRALDLLPNPPKQSTASVTTPLVALAASTVLTASSSAPEAPVKIEIAKINLTTTVTNPTTTDIESLDTYLLKGAVRYPTSALLNATGNVVIFGHSSYLPIVGNQAYKTFDGIQKLEKGDTIMVYSVGTVYTYRVRTVVKESVATDARVDLAVAGSELTLVTCNSFATKADRFVVKADFVESHSISTN